MSVVRFRRADVGTSDAFGGSDTSDWNTARETYIELLSDPSPITDTAARVMASSIGAALSRGNQSSTNTPVSELLASHRAKPESSSAGHGRTRRGGASFSRQAGRGGLAIAAFDAWRREDLETARDLGIDLSKLAGLDDRELCVQLVDTIIGPPAHPDDQALRKTLIALLRKALAEQPRPDVNELLSRLVESLAWQHSSVQLTVDVRSNRIDIGRARAVEDKVKRYIAGTVRGASKSLADHSPQFIANYAEALAARACRALGKFA
jgi:hypothetical protein